MVWDKEKPQGNQKIRLSDDEIRANNAALEAAIDLDHDFTTGGTQTGEHHKVTLQKQETDPSEEADKGKLYTKVEDEEVELFYRDKTAAHILQLTRKGDHALFAKGDRIIQPQDTASLGWTIVDTLDDKLVYITKGKAAGGSPGGEAHLGSFAFDGGSNADALQENDVIQRVGGGTWSCRLRSIEYSGAAPNQIGRIYYDTLAGGTPANNDPIDCAARSFTATIDGVNKPAGVWTISGLSGSSHAHSIPVLTLQDGAQMIDLIDVSTMGPTKNAAEEMINTDRAANGGSYRNKIKCKTGAATSGGAGVGISADGEWRPSALCNIVVERD